MQKRHFLLCLKTNKKKPTTLLKKRKQLQETTTAHTEANTNEGKLSK